jgi:DNA-directed RNA polymerase specialized sigma24 family protein
MIEAEPHDVDALTGSLLDWLEDEPDPLRRYFRIAADLALYRAVVELLAEAHDACVVALHGSGASYADIADLTGLTRSRVQQLTERGSRR